MKETRDTHPIPFWYIPTFGCPKQANLSPFFVTCHDFITCDFGKNVHISWEVYFLFLCRVYIAALIRPYVPVIFLGAFILGTGGGGKH